VIKVAQKNRQTKEVAAAAATAKIYSCRVVSTQQQAASASQDHDIGKKTKQNKKSKQRLPMYKKPRGAFLFFLSAKLTNEMAGDA
jgi:hypothetical protein